MAPVSETAEKLVALINGKHLPCRHRTGTSSHGQTVTALILRMPGMTFQPVEDNAVPTIDIKKTHPQINVPDFLPTFALPVPEPALVHRLHHIRRIAKHLNLSVLPFDSLKSLYHCKQLHPVVGGADEATAHLLLAPGTFKHHAITARPGIPAGSSVSIKEYSWSCRILFHSRKVNKFRESIYRIY